MDPLMVNQFFEQHFWWLLLAALWTLPWKGVALWRAARNQQLRWFVALLLVNTLAILEITYIFYFSQHRHEHEKEPGESDGPDLEK